MQVGTTVSEVKRESPRLASKHGSRRYVWILLTSALVMLSIKYMSENGMLSRITGVISTTEPRPPGPVDYTTTERLKQMMIAMGVRIYGSDSCPWSRKQIEDLSIRSDDARLFVDCEKMPSEAKDIEAYPSWKTRHGKKLVGYMTAEKAMAVLQADLYKTYDESFTPIVEVSDDEGHTANDAAPPGTLSHHRTPDPIRAGPGTGQPIKTEPVAPQTAIKTEPVAPQPAIEPVATQPAIEPVAPQEPSAPPPTKKRAPGSTDKKKQGLTVKLAAAPAPTPAPPPAPRAPESADKTSVALGAAQAAAALSAGAVEAAHGGD